MRLILNTVSMDGVIVIGEGEAGGLGHARLLKHGMEKLRDGGGGGVVQPDEEQVHGSLF